MCCLHPYTKQNNEIFIQTFRCAIALWKSWVWKYSIYSCIYRFIVVYIIVRFQVIKLKLLCETLKDEKFLLDIQTKCSNIANKILNAAIDTERTFKCKWPKRKQQSGIIPPNYQKVCGMKRLLKKESQSNRKHFSHVFWNILDKNGNTFWSRIK